MTLVINYTDNNTNINLIHVYFQLCDTTKLFNNIIIVYFKSNAGIHTPELENEVKMNGF